MADDYSDYYTNLKTCERYPEVDKFLATAEAPERMQIALGLIIRFGGIDGGHHKQWVLDQVARVLTGDGYEEMVKYANDGEDGPDTWDWDTGIAP
jgi:hypothetical protein